MTYENASSTRYPGLGGRLNRLLVEHDSPTSLSGRARRARWRLFQEMFPEIGSMRVLDLGGTVQSWTRLGIRPTEVTVLNTFTQTGAPLWIKPVVGDACQVPPGLVRERFDLVFSNSVLEHVGGHHRRLAFAESVHAFSDRHWIQTPYRYFPLEPHWLFPLFQFLPLRVRLEVTKRWPLIPARAKTTEEAIRRSLGSELLSKTHMTYYFPHSVVRTEQVGGLVKSLIATK